MKYLFLLVALLLATRPVAAQVSRRAARPDSLLASLPTPPAAPDTVAALHRLFAHKRKKLKFILLGTVTAEVAGQAIINSTVHGGGFFDNRVVSQVLVGALAIPIVLGEVIFYAQYNRKHEQRAIDKLQAHQLSNYLKRQLKAQYFR